jgi:transitional endoplasmic reticulum ATPase
MPLKVMETTVMDFARIRARVDRYVMSEIGVREEDILRLHGKRVTYAKCFPLLQAMEVSKAQSKTIIRMDSLLRSNLGVKIGDTIIASKAKSLPATNVTVRALEALPPIDEGYLTETFEGLPLAIDDKVMIEYFGGRLVFNVVEIRSEQADGILNANSAHIVTGNTAFNIIPKEER